jgi:hypothetical protein
MLANHIHWRHNSADPDCGISGLSAHCTLAYAQNLQRCFRTCPSEPLAISKGYPVLTSVNYALVVESAAALSVVR